MARPASLTVQSNEPVSIGLTGATPHIFRYKMWLRRPDSADWQLLGRGTISAAMPNRIDIQPPIAKGTKLQCWLGIATANQNTPYRAECRVEQHGALVTGGQWDEEDPMTSKSATATAWILEFVT